MEGEGEEGRWGMERWGLGGRWDRELGQGWGWLLHGEEGEGGGVLQGVGEGGDAGEGEGLNGGRQTERERQPQSPLHNTSSDSVQIDRWTDRSIDQPTTSPHSSETASTPMPTTTTGAAGELSAGRAEQRKREGSSALLREVDGAASGWWDSDAVCPMAHSAQTTARLLAMERGKGEVNRRRVRLLVRMPWHHLGHDRRRCGRAQALWRLSLVVARCGWVTGEVWGMAWLRWNGRGRMCHPAPPPAPLPPFHWVGTAQRGRGCAAPAAAAPAEQLPLPARMTHHTKARTDDLSGRIEPAMQCNAASPITTRDLPNRRLW